MVTPFLELTNFLKTFNIFCVNFNQFILADIIDDVINLPEVFWENYFRIIFNKEYL